MNKNYIILFILIIIPIAINPYPWPISPFNTQHPITATLGEYRPPYGSLGKHFHWGVDIGESAGVSVFSVKSGVIEGKGNEYVIIDNYRYVHITPKVNIGDSVIAFVDTIGIIKDIGTPGSAGDHLHFAEGMGGISNRVNPLRTGGLTPYADNAMPAVYGGNNYRFYRHGENNIIASPLYGKVDILTKAKDAQSNNGSPIVGVYRIGYQVNDEAGKTILPYTENIKFDNVNGILDSVYGSESDISNYYYWVTNALSANNCYRYWNTKLKSGQNWNGVDAIINSDAEYPDGEYRVWVLAYDIKGNGGDTLNQHGAEYKDIILDNFLPEISNIFGCYKKGFSIRYSEVMNYNSAMNIANYTLSKAGSFTPIYIDYITQDKFDPQVFHIITSQEMGYIDYNLSLNNVKDLAGNVIDTDITFEGSAASIPLYGLKIVDLPSYNNKRGTKADESFNDILNPGERVHLKPEFLNMYYETVIIYSESLANMPEYNINIDTGFININESVEPDSLISLPKPFSIKIPENYDKSEIGFNLINSNSLMQSVKDTIMFYVPVNKRISSISYVLINDSPELGIFNTGDGIVDANESTNVFISLKNNDQDTLKNVIITTKLMVNDNYKEDINLSNNRLYYGNIGPYEEKIPSTLLKLNTNGFWNVEEDIVLVISITYILNNKSYWEMSNWLIPGYKQYSDTLNSDTLWLGAFSPNNDGYKDSINIPFNTAYSYPILRTRKISPPFDTIFYFRDKAEKLGIDISPEKAYKEYDGPFEKGSNYSVDWDGSANKEIEDGKHCLKLREPISSWYKLWYILRHTHWDYAIQWLGSEGTYFSNSKSSSKYSVLIDRVPPSIFNIECDKWIFSSGDKTKVNFYTSESCSVWVKISDIEDSLWYKDSDTDFVHNNKEFVWYGTNNSGVNVPPGFYHFHIYARDFSNPETEKVITLQIDNSVPFLNIEKPIWNSSYNGDSTISCIARFKDKEGIVQNSESLFIKKQGENYNCYPSITSGDSLLQASINIPGDGRYYLKVIVYNISGRNSTCELPFYIDNIPPQLNITNPQNDTTVSNNEGEITFALHYEDNIDSFVTYPFDKMIFITIEDSLNNIIKQDTITNCYYRINKYYNWDFKDQYGNLISNGNNFKCIATIYDLAGNKSQDSVLFNMDSQSPKLNIISPIAPNPYVKLDSSLEMIYSTNEFTEFVITFNNQSGFLKNYFPPPCSTYFSDCTLKISKNELNNIPDGVYNIKLRAIDKYENDTIINNILGEGIEYLRIDRESPEIISAVCVPWITDESGKTELRLKLSEKRDAILNRGNVSLKIYFDSLELLYDTIINPGNNIFQKNIVLIVDTTKIGIQELHIDTKDKWGNSNSALSQVAYKSLGTKITKPENSENISSQNVIIKGWATDPNMYNATPFTYFELLWKSMNNSHNIKEDNVLDWNNNRIYVIPSLRDSIYMNRGIREVGSENILGYFNPPSTGKYMVKLTSYEQSGNTLKDSVIFIVSDTTASSFSIDTLFIKLIDCDNDGKFSSGIDTLVLYYRILGDESNVEINIMNYNNSSIWSRRIDNVMPGLIYNTKWDGSKKPIGYVSGGLYKIIITAYNTNNNEIAQKEKEITVKSNLTIDTLFTVPEEFSPIGTNGVANLISLHYKVDEDAFINTYIDDNNGNKMQTIDENKHITGGLYQISNWNGYSNGEIVDTGEYYYKLIVSNESYSDTIQDSVMFKVIDSIPTSQGDFYIPGNYAEGIIHNDTVYDGKAEYYWVAKPNGEYYPPQSFKLIDTISGYNKRKIKWSVDCYGKELWYSLFNKKDSVYSYANGGSNPFDPPDSVKSPVIYFTPHSNNIHYNMHGYIGGNGCIRAVIKRDNDGSVLLNYSESHSGFPATYHDSAYVPVDSGSSYSFYTISVASIYTAHCSLSVRYKDRTQCISHYSANALEFSSPLQGEINTVTRKFNFASGQQSKYLFISPYTDKLILSIKGIITYPYFGYYYICLVNSDNDSICWLRSYNSYTMEYDTINVIPNDKYYLYINGICAICSLKVTYESPVFADTLVGGNQINYVPIGTFNNNPFKKIHSGNLNISYKYMVNIDNLNISVDSVDNDTIILNKNGVNVEFVNNGQIYSKCDSGDIHSKWRESGMINDTIYSDTTGYYSKRTIYTIEGNPHIFDIPDSVVQNCFSYSEPIVLNNQYVQASLNGDSISCNVENWDSSWAMESEDPLLDSIYSNEIFTENTFRKHGLSNKTMFNQRYSQLIGDSLNNSIGATFWNNGDSSNPYLKINNWDLGLYYINGSPNRDVSIISKNGDSLIYNNNRIGQNVNDYFQVQHFIDTILPVSYIPIYGNSNGNRYKLYYSNEGGIYTINNEIQNSKIGMLGGLNSVDISGKINIIMDLYEENDQLIERKIKSFYIGDIISGQIGGSANSPYFRLQMECGTGSINKDTVIRIKRVKPEVVMNSKNSMYISDPVLEILPKDIVFNHYPTITYRYTEEEVNYYNINPDNLGIYAINKDGVPVLLTVGPPVLEDSIYTLTTTYNKRAYISNLIFAVMENNEVDTIKPHLFQIYDSHIDSVKIQGYWKPNDTLMIVVTDPAPNIYDALKNVGINRMGKTRRNCEQSDTFTTITDNIGYFSEYIKLFNGNNHIFAGNANALRHGVRVMHGIESPWDGEGIRNSVIGTVNITMDSIPPIVNIIDSLPVVNANISDTLKFFQNEPGILYYTVYNPDGEMIEFSNFNVNAYDTIFAIWQGMEDGKYSYQIFGIDNVGNRSENKEGYWNVDRIRPQIDGLYNQPDPFVPSLGETTTIYYNLSENCKTVIINITNQYSVNIFNNILENVNIGLNSIVWDGKYQANPLSPGEYKYSIIAYDSAGNISNQISQIAHIIEDSIPPITELIIGSPHFGSPTIINLNTPLILNASDNASGVKETWYIIDNNIQNFIPPELLPFEFTIGNIEGRHVLKYWSIDSLNNIENIKSESIFVDTTTPITNIILGPPEFDSVYINSNSIIELIANDPVSNEVSSGISEINYKINSSNWHKVHSNKVDFNINGNDGYYIINFNSIDNVENKENLKKDTLILDNTPPILQFIVGEPKYGYDTTYLISVTLITLNVNDGNGSGVKSSDYRVDLDDWINFNSGFEFNLSNYGEGVHLIKLKSIDNLNNIRIINHIFGVDDTPPISELRLDGINFNYGDSTIINSQTNIIITARDSISCGVASGAKDIEYRINYSNWVLTNQDSISFSINGIDSLYKIDYYSIDNVLNTENIKSKYLILDNTSPEVEIISPLDSTLINGTITIIGTAKDAHFKYYELAYNEGVNPSNWNIITHSNIPVYKNLLGEWNTEGLNEGLYTLRLIATDMVGNTNEARIIIYIGKPEFLFEIKDFNKCEGVDVDDVGNIYVSDRNASSNPTHNRIAKYDMFGNFLFQIIDLRKPDDVALSDWGSIFVSEWAGNSVVEYSSEGDSIRSITDLLKPDGIDVKRVKLSNLFNNEEESLIISVADQNHNRILIYDSTLALLSEIVVQHPEGISLSKDGFVYTCLKDNGIIRKYDFNGNVMLEIDGFSSPSDVEIDNRGYIWVVDRNNNRICMFDSTGNMLMNFGGIGNEQGKFNKPEGISLSYEKDNSKVNRVHISDRNNNRVCVFKMPLFGNAQILSGFIKTNEEAIAIKECVPYPNPFNPIKENSNIRIKVNKDCKIEMFIYTLSGKNVWKTNIIGIGGLVNEIEWNGRNNSAELVRNGVYNVLVRAIKDNEKDEAWTKILLYKR